PQQGARPPPPGLLAAVRPRYVLFSTGYLNRYGHPPPAAVAGYRALGAPVLDTVQEGAITLRVEQPGQLHPHSYRRQSRRYWQSP
ncbi:MAG: DNA internalization-related competence protein ComEC/Rec2, partial [Pseudomonadota bacterium]|nr:DNA internalization-related competence protein ComEC/Rec2 [Pseudomonadota bacterium]